ncbi:MAG: hypothetical protein HZB43_05705 [candidate division Zixibacteria bacterium]|nr:hypothetical protein [candidate division Zixibacteria bacterium]
MDEVNAGGTGEVEKLREENARLRQQLELNRTALHYLERLAHRFSGEEAALENPDQIRAFCERIVHGIDVLIQEFRELLSGRKSFQKDFGLDRAAADSATRVWRSENFQDMLRRLFDWKSTSLDDTQIKELRAAIDELKYHQLALLAGYEQSSREGTLEVLRTLAPETIRAEVIGKEGDAGTSLFRRLNPFRNLLLWKEYQRRYQELVSEDTGQFEKLFRPVFRRGYREVMLAKMTSRQGDQHSSGKGDR